MKNLSYSFLLLIPFSSYSMHQSSAYSSSSIPNVSSSKKLVCPHNCTCTPCLKHIQETLQNLHLKDKFQELQEKKELVDVDPKNLPFEPRRPAEEEMRRQLAMGEAIYQQIMRLNADATRFHELMTSTLPVTPRSSVNGVVPSANSSTSTNQESLSVNKKEKKDTRNVQRDQSVTGFDEQCRNDLAHSVPLVRSPRTKAKGVNPEA